MKIKNSWFIIVPFAHGYLGRSNAGQIFGTDRLEVINHLIALSFK